MTCAFTVAILVISGLLALNNIARWTIGFLLYPMFSFAVDAGGMGSTFRPNIWYALLSLKQTDGVFFGDVTPARFTSSICRGVLGSRVMKRYFSDDLQEV